MAKSISWSQPDWAHITLDEDITKDRPTNKQQLNSIQVYLYSAFQRCKSLQSSFTENLSLCIIFYYYSFYKCIIMGLTSRGRNREGNRKNERSCCSNSAKKWHVQPKQNNENMQLIGCNWRTSLWDTLCECLAKEMCQTECVLEWPFIVASLRHTCAIIMLSN